MLEQICTSWNHEFERPKNLRGPRIGGEKLVHFRIDRTSPEFNKTKGTLVHEYG